MHTQVVAIGGFTFAGFEGSPTYNRRKYLQYTEEQVKTFTDSLPPVDCFIAHSNPAEAIIEDETDAHRGFLAFTQYVQEKKLKYLIHGHIHEKKCYTMAETTIVSVYSF